MINPNAMPESSCRASDAKDGFPLRTCRNDNWACGDDVIIVDVMPEGFYRASNAKDAILPRTCGIITQGSKVDSLYEHAG